jgi:glucose 1-dehydrogenase
VHEVIPKPGFIAYSISKGGMGNMTKTLALEYAGRGIRVNAVAPGAIRTDMNARWLEDPKAKQAVESHIPMGRSAAAEEMAAVFAFLASDDASYITGQGILVDGGLLTQGRTPAGELNLPVVTPENIDELFPLEQPARR